MLKSNIWLDPQQVYTKASNVKFFYAIHTTYPTHIMLFDDSK
jgi:Neuraminidase (sialidase)